MGLKSKKSGIERLDTNIMIRYITRDNEKMLRKVKKLFSNKNKLYVFEDAAMMEVVYVLSTEFYKYPRELIAAKIKAVMKTENLVLNKGLIEDSLDLYVKHPQLSFVDCYLSVASVISNEKPLWTFDKALAKKLPSIAREL